MQLATFDIIELIWSLCEILFIDTLPGELTRLQSELTHCRVS